MAEEISLTQEIFYAEYKDLGLTEIWGQLALENQSKLLLGSPGTVYPRPCDFSDTERCAVNI